MGAREKLHRLQRNSRPLKKAAVNRERYMEKLSDAYFSHLGCKCWEREEGGRTPIKAGAMESLDHWFGNFSKNIGRFGSGLASEAGEMARGGLPEELLRRQRRQQVRKVAGAAVLAFGLLAGASMSVNALSSNPWKQQMEEQSDNRISIFSEQEDLPPGPAQREGYYDLGYIPKGFVQKVSHIWGDNVSKTYRKGNKQLVFDNRLLNLNVYAAGFLADSFRYHWGEAEVTYLKERNEPGNGIAICYMNERIVTFSFIGVEQAELKKIVENLKFFETE